MEGLAKKFRGAAYFVFIYTREAHPLQAVQVTTWQQRRQRVTELQRALGGQRPILVDSIGAVSTQARYRATANAVFIVGTNGQIAAKMQRPTPRAVEQFLQTWLPAERTPAPAS